MVLLPRMHAWVDRLAMAPGVRPWLEARYERQFRDNRDQNLFRGVYASFEQAAGSAPPSRPLGYDHDEAAMMYRQRMSELYPTDYPALFWLGHCFAQGLRKVFELGGHVGVSYYSYQRVLDYPAGLDWVVHDVPTVMQRGRSLAAHVDRLGRLRFADDFASAGEAEVFVAMGVLQYLPESLAQRLQGLRKLPPALLLNLTPLHPEASYYTLQSIGTAFCPYRIEREADLRGALEALGYQQRDAWVNPDKSCFIPFEPAHSLQGYRGSFWQRDTTGE